MLGNLSRTGVEGGGFVSKWARIFGYSLEYSDGDRRESRLEVAPACTLASSNRPEASAPWAVAGERHSSAHSVSISNGVLSACDDSDIRGINSLIDFGCKSGDVNDGAGVLVNGTGGIRPATDRFGRLVTELRKKFTAGDSQPFPLAPI